MTRLRKSLFTEKIPGIVCTVACMVSVLMGFGLGYIYFGASEIVYAADTVHHKPNNITTAIIPSEQYEPEAYQLSVPYDSEDATHPLYIVTTLDGYIVIYHAKENGGEIKELTSTSVCMLTTEELEQLQYGIEIYSEEALARILQDYGS